MENLKYIIIFVVVLVVAVFIWAQAFKSMKRTNKMRRETMAKMDRIKALSDRYATLIGDDLASISDADLFDAVIIRIWKKLGKEEEELANFNALSSAEKNIYTAWYIREEATNDGFSAYFRNCGNTLGKLSEDVMATLGLYELDPIIKRACEMFDENSEVSCDKNQIKAIDEQFKSAYNAEAYCRAAADYIKSNADKFVDPDSVLREIDTIEG